MSLFKAIVVIPARLASLRLPHKVLADIGGHPMLWHVYQRCLQASKVDEVHVATDAEEVAKAVREWGGKVWMTDSTCVSGTERIVTIVDKLEGDIIINVQGDQPLIEPELINQVIDVFEKVEPLPDIVTPVCSILDEKIFNPNLVKVIRRHDGYALYFSRHSIPYIRNNRENGSKSITFWGHIGIYGYRRKILEEYHLLPKSYLEDAEKLEQLRFLQAGKSIFTFVTSHYPISVDTQADLEKVRSLL
ncbi:MAG: 3-deoxy-manno-octulosonate cytidylyltransferase [Gammaproteobacteria bacterium]|nr:MAG: 3-deoxy-manno-octulosonate cytidylyltransferase [Gammaproteobacteria bacterium]RKZ45107.1 MAG: 3-deoxy-manno-octulosonate cytidylyltransferase [Gammaproteobacteria bacterium]RKZ73493.1 MAG: 3-deoxy-manno-octulosonate cytidylyltransferase [Gammaproteobacteria bacterium]